jgi:hypothetical protein
MVTGEEKASFGTSQRPLDGGVGIMVVNIWRSYGLVEWAIVGVGRLVRINLHPTAGSVCQISLGINGCRFHLVNSFLKLPCDNK